MSDELAGKVPYNQIIIPEKNVKAYVLLMYFLRNGVFYFLCHKCSDVHLIGHLSKDTDVSEIEHSYCIHAQAAKVIWTDDDLDEKIETCKEGQIHILQEKPIIVTIVYPPTDTHKLPAVVSVNARTSNPKCYQCKGRNYCLHVNIYLSKCHNERYREATIDTDNIEVTTATGVSESAKLVKSKHKEVKDDAFENPFNLTGKATNIFDLKINYPPGDLERKRNNKINDVKNLFHTKVMVPKVKQCDTCDCGNTWNEDYDISNCESHEVHIHHSRSTTDSRNSKLLLLYLKTDKCNCTLFYKGQDDGILRVNKARLKHRPGTVIHFVTYDLLNTYYEQQMQSGQPKDSFIKSLNSLNKDFRGSSAEIPI